MYLIELTANLYKRYYEKDNILKYNIININYYYYL